jgi:hypothetical protein
MYGLASFVMRGRSQAAMAATVLAMLALLVPLLSILSSAVVAFVTLRKGLTDGLVVGAISALASGLLSYLLLDSPAPVVGFLLVLWLPVWVLGALLRSSRSLDLAAQLALGFGLVLLAVFYLQLGEPQAQWEEILQPMAAGFVESQVMDAAQSQTFVQLVAAWMTGIFAAGFYFQLLLALLLARSWQARLYNPGGFQVEFHALRTSRVLGLVALPLLGLTLLQGVDAPGLVRDLGLLLVPLFFLQGLAVAHNVVASTRLSRGWLVALYILMFVAIPHMVILVTLIGVADVFADFRSRIKPTARPE